MAPKPKASASTRRSVRIKSNADALAALASKAKGNATSTPDSPPALLTIPPELRNRISSYVLQEQTPIEVTQSLCEPAYLLVSRQLRSEARALWYHDNRFHVDVKDCDAEILTAFVIRTGMKMWEHIVLSIAVSGAPHWENLVRWCREAYEGNAPALGFGIGNGPADFIAAALDIVSRRPRRSWEDCLEMLNILRVAVAGYDPRWLS